MRISVFMSRFFTSPLWNLRYKIHTQPQRIYIPTKSTDERPEEILNYHPDFTEKELKHGIHICFRMHRKGEADAGM